MCTCVHGSVGAVCVCVHACVCGGLAQKGLRPPLVLRTPTGGRKSSKQLRRGHRVWEVVKEGGEISVTLGKTQRLDPGQRGGHGGGRWDSVP